MRSSVLLLYIANLLLLSCPSSYAKTTVRLTNGEWPPFTSAEFKHGGVLSHLVTKAYETQGIHVEYTYMPWKRSYRLAQNGQYDGSIIWAPTVERRKNFYFSDPVTENQKVFFRLKTLRFDWQKVSELKRFRIGATDQYTYGAEFDRATKDGTLKIQFATKDELNIRKLFAGRIDLFPMDIEVGYYLISREISPMHAHLATNHPKPLLKTPMCVMITKELKPKTAKLFIDSLNKGLNILRESGEYESMILDSRTGLYQP